MKICLVRCPCINLSYPPPIGLAYINSFLRRANHEVVVFDLNVELFHCIKEEGRKRWNVPDSPDLIKLSEEIISDYPGLVNEYVRKIVKTEATIIGFSVWDSNVSFSLKIAKEIKRLNRKIFIMFGGPECFPRWSGNSLIKEDCVDVVVYGDGEEIVKDIIDSLEYKGEIGFHKGTIVKGASGIIDCGRRDPVRALDTLPFPDFDNFPLDKYLTKELFIEFNRGCKRRCAYCSAVGTLLQYRWRSASSIYEEIVYQVNKYPHIDKFHVASPALNSNLKQLSELCDLITENGLKIRWSGFAVIDKNMDLNLLKKMNRAGCFGLNFGIESGSQNTINKMYKDYKVEDAEQNMRDAYRLGIEVMVNFIVGFPGETEDDFRQTLDFISRNQRYISYVGSLRSCWVEPYAYMYDHPAEFGIITEITNSGPYLWSCRENNYEMRKLREAKLREFVDLLKIGMAGDRIKELNQNLGHCNGSG